METFQSTLTKKTVLPGNVDLLELTLKSPSSFAFAAGQYIVLTVPHEVLPVKRLYSVASSPVNDKAIELLIKRVPGGIASNYIATFDVGRNVDFQGPAGMFTLKPTPHEKVFLTTGTGIAPIRSFLLSNKSHPQPFHLFWGLSTYKEAYLIDELVALHRQDPRLTVTVCLSREKSLDIIPEELRPYFSLGHIDECAHRAQMDLPQKALEYYICGRREMVEAMRIYLENQHIDKEFVHFERY